MAQHISPGKIILVLTNLLYSIGAFIADWNETHVKNPNWPPHARFHNGQTMSLGVFLASTSLYFLLKSAASKQQALDNLFSASIVGTWYCLAGLSAILYPGADWTDADIGRGGPQKYVFTGIVAMIWTERDLSLIIGLLHTFNILRRICIAIISARQGCDWDHDVSALFSCKAITEIIENFCSQSLQQALSEAAKVNDRRLAFASSNNCSSEPEWLIDPVKMPIGRGGAGNIQALELENASKNIDLEANSHTEVQRPDVREYDLSREEPLYAHTGRGGAGNYYSPRDLRETGQFVNAHTSHIFGDGTPAPDFSIETANQSVHTGTGVHSNAAVTQRSSIESKRSISTAAPQNPRMYGRGGVGNLIYGVTESEWRAADNRITNDKEREDRIRSDTEQAVRAALSVPPKAKLSGPEP